VFRWDPIEDKHYYSGKSYVLERIRSRHDMNKEDMVREVKRRVEILEWMCVNNVRIFKDVAKIVASYAENQDALMKIIRDKTTLKSLSSPEEHVITSPEKKNETDTHDSLGPELLAHPQQPTIPSSDDERKDETKMEG
jgi:hypothetical protein